MGAGRKLPPPPPYQFLPVTSTNVEISLRNFLTFSFNSFATLVQYFMAIPSASSKLFNLKQEHPSKKNDFFWSNPYKIEFMISHRNARVTKLCSHYDIYNII